MVWIPGNCDLDGRARWEEVGFGNCVVGRMHGVCCRTGLEEMGLSVRKCYARLMCPEQRAKNPAFWTPGRTALLRAHWSALVMSQLPRSQSARRPPGRLRGE